MKSKKDYINMLNDLGNSLSREEWIIGGKDRYTGRDNYGVMLKRYDPIGISVGKRRIWLTTSIILFLLLYI